MGLILLQIFIIFISSLIGIVATFGFDTPRDLSILTLIPFLGFFIVIFISCISIKKRFNNKLALHKFIIPVFFILLSIILINSYFSMSSKIISNYFYKNKQNINRINYVSNTNKLFQQPQLIKDVGLTKYDDFYLITDENVILIPITRYLKGKESGGLPVENNLSNLIKLSNLKKLINKKVKVEVLANKNNLHGGSPVHGDDYDDNYPISGNTYYITEISYNNLFIDLDYNLCNPNDSEKFYCDTPAINRLSIIQ